MSLITISDVYSVFPLFRNSLRRRRWFSAVVSGPDECIDGWMDGWHGVEDGWCLGEHENISFPQQSDGE